MRHLYVGFRGFIDRTTGAGLRCRMTLSGLSRTGSVDILEITRPRRPVARIQSVLRRFGLGVSGDGRESIPFTDEHARREVAARLATDQYDTLWFSTPHVFLYTHPSPELPVVVDFPRLESLALERECALLSQGREGPPSTRSVPEAHAMERASREWRELERGIIEQADVAIVCTEIDRALLRTPEKVRVVPTGYPVPKRMDAELLPARRPPTFAIQGTLHLQQNLDAAQYFAHEILPRVRNVLPDAELRVIGHYPKHVQELSWNDGVTLTGSVQDMTPELAKADAAVAPLRHGGGIHVKIIEAMAHRLPVVSSSLGIEGIDIVPGEHVLTADDAPGFASACVELLTNDGLRRGLVERAWSLYWSRYRMELMEEQIAQVARSIRDENPNEPSVGRR